MARRARCPWYLAVVAAAILATCAIAAEEAGLAAAQSESSATPPGGTPEKKEEKETAAADKAAAVGDDDGKVYELVLSDSKTANAPDVLGVFQQLGISDEQAQQILAVVTKQGSAPVLMGSKESVQAVAELFEKVEMKATVRVQEAPPKTPSEFDGSDVDVLSEAEFMKEVWESDQGALVMFYAPWCGHCKQTAPELMKAATRLRGGGVRVVAVDCDQARTLAQKLGIKGYPTIQYITHGRRTDYNGPRSALALASFAQNRARLEGIRATVTNAVGGVKVAMSRVLGRGGAVAAS